MALVLFRVNRSRSRISAAIDSEHAVSNYNQVVFLHAPFAISLIGVADNLQSKHQRPVCNMAVKNLRQGELYRNVNNATIKKFAV